MPEPIPAGGNWGGGGSLKTIMDIIKEVMSQGQGQAERGRGILEDPFVRGELDQAIQTGTLSGFLAKHPNLTNRDYYAISAYINSAQDVEKKANSENLREKDKYLYSTALPGEAKNRLMQELATDAQTHGVALTKEVTSAGELSTKLGAGGETYRQATLGANPHLAGQDVIPAGSAISAPSSIKYTVNPGDTLETIAKRFGVSPEELAKQWASLGIDPATLAPGVQVPILTAARGVNPATADMAGKLPLPTGAGPEQSYTAPTDSTSSTSTSTTPSGRTDQPNDDEEWVNSLFDQYGSLAPEVLIRSIMEGQTMPPDERQRIADNAQETELLNQLLVATGVYGPENNPMGKRDIYSDLMGAPPSSAFIREQLRSLSGAGTGADQGIDPGAVFGGDPNNILSVLGLLLNQSLGSSVASRVAPDPAAILARYEQEKQAGTTTDLTSLLISLGLI